MKNSILLHWEGRIKSRRYRRKVIVADASLQLISRLWSDIVGCQGTFLQMKQTRIVYANSLLIYSIYLHMNR